MNFCATPPLQTAIRGIVSDMKDGLALIVVGAVLCIVGIFGVLNAFVAVNIPQVVWWGIFASGPIILPIGLSVVMRSTPDTDSFLVRIGKYTLLFGILFAIFGPLSMLLIMPIIDARGPFAALILMYIVTVPTGGAFAVLGLIISAIGMALRKTDLA